MKMSRSVSDTSASTLSALAVAAQRSRGYPYCSSAYDPLAATVAGVENILEKKFLYEDGHDIVYSFEVRDGRGKYCSYSPDDLNELPDVLVLFPLWKTIPQDKIFLSKSFFLNILTRCDINPTFIQMLGFPNTVGAGASALYQEEHSRSFHVYVRYPHTYPELECALYLGHYFSTAKTTVMFLEGHGTVISKVGYILQELAENIQLMPQHPFAYLIPFITEMGRAMDRLRAKEREDVAFVEKSTDTGEVDPFQIGARNTENIPHLTRLAHLRSASTARLQKLLRFHIRAVDEVMKAYRKYERLASTTMTPQIVKEHARLETLLDQELDLCRGRTMETENLVKRTDLQINVVRRSTCCVVLHH